MPSETHGEQSGRVVGGDTPVPDAEVVRDEPLANDLPLPVSPSVVGVGVRSHPFLLRRDSTMWQERT